MVEIKYWYPCATGEQDVLKGYPKELVTGLRFIPFNVVGHVVYRRTGEKEWHHACKVQFDKEEVIERGHRVAGRALCKTCAKSLAKLDTATQSKLAAWVSGEAKVA